MTRLSAIFLLLPAIAGLCSCNGIPAARTDFSEWTRTGGNSSNNKYSSLSQIDTTNVNRLRVAWEYHSGDADTAAHSQIQCNPIVVDGLLYGTSPALKLFALDAATGKAKWIFDPFQSSSADSPAKTRANLNNNRGVAYWSDGKNDRRIFYVAGQTLYAVDALTGKAVGAFGENGKVDLHTGLGEAFKDLFVTSTVAPTIYKNVLITGTRVSEGMDAAPGHIRGFDVVSGKMIWIFHTIPQPGEPGYESWEDKDAWKLTGGANCWMGLTVDEQTGIAYIPLGSASMDFYGGRRKGNDLYGDCMLALQAETGKYKWHFQYIHHDIWDWDPSSAPVLLTVTHEGKKIDAVAQTTKTGFVFLFDRASGAPLFPVKETAVDTATTLAGEKLSPTQPVPQKPAPFVRQQFLEKDINPYLSTEEYDSIKTQLAEYRTGKMFLPQTKTGTIIFPGFDGGGEYGGPSVDPETNILYVNANEMAWILKMLDVKGEAAQKETYLQAGERLFRQNCMSCHGADRKGSGNYPSLLEVKKKYSPAEFLSFINAGRRMMPSFLYLGESDKAAIASFVLEDKKEQSKQYVGKTSAADSFRSVPYSISGYNKFLSKSGLPAVAPPWGTLTAIDLNSGEHVWTTVLGNDDRLAGKAPGPTGTENYGGSVVTRGGLLFIGAARDGMFRVFDKRSGKLLMETKLPHPNFATPAVYSVKGKEFIVLACGGGKLGTGSGDSYVAYSLP